ncbi:MAG TPA: methyltransferase [Candidatus Binataceae bacterium]|nr:methyltransferase [Candidatus Binataceae bacterium]
MAKQTSRRGAPSTGSRGSKSPRGNAAVKIPSPVPMMEDLWASWRTYALAAAFELGVFTHIASGAQTAEAVAAKASASAPAMRRLLDAMVAMGYLRRKGETYSLSPEAETYLVRGRPLYAEGAEMMARGLSMGWSQLAEAVRTGRPVMPAAEPGRGRREFFPMLVKVIFPTSYAAARAAVAAIAAPQRAKLAAILDVAAGSGAWSIAFAEAIPTAHVTVVDYPEVTPIAREFAERHGVADRYDYLEGNLREVDFGRARYDLVILGHIVHGEGREHGRRLIERSAEALRERGMLLIGDFIPRDDRTGPPIPMLFGLNMLIGAPEGDVFTLREYREWLKGAGFRQIRVLRAPAPSPLILAIK